MAVTLAIFAVIQIFWPGVVRAHLIPPASIGQALSTASCGLTMVSPRSGKFELADCSVSGLHGGWVVSTQPVDAADHPVTKSLACAPQTNFVPCLADHRVRLAVSYQPANRYWAFQWLETGIFLALALGLGSICYWRIRRVN